MKSIREIIVLKKIIPIFIILFLALIVKTIAQDVTDKYDYERKPVFIIDGKKYSHNEISNFTKNRKSISKTIAPYVIDESVNNTHISSAQAPNSEYKTKNVFVFVIDGIRNTEGMEAKTDFLFNIWTKLRPLGTMNTHYYNKSITLTTSGHYALLSGANESLINNSNTPQTLRPYFPCLFEYNRKTTGSPELKNLFVSGKNTIVKYPVSLHPSYGVPYKPNIILTSHHDFDTYDTAVKLIFKDHPTLTYIIFAQVDAYGHTYDQDDYYGSIYQVDYLISDLYDKIMKDPYYKDNTTIIITSDHGRHDKEHGGWKEHGDNCHGCRHIPFLAIGPDFKKNCVISNDYDITDLTPTIAHLLHLPAPFAYGQIMTEIFENYIPDDDIIYPPLIFGEQNVSNNGTHSTEPSIDLTEEKINIVYTDETTSKKGIYFTKSDQGGFYWTLPKPILASQNSSFCNPVLKVVSDTMLLVAANGLFTNSNDSTYDWITYSNYSKDTGIFWSSPVGLETPATYTTKPAISANHNRVNIISQQFTHILSNSSNDQGITFDIGTTVFDSSSYYNLNFPQHPSAVHIDNRCFAMWHTLMPSRKRGSLCYAIEPWDNKGAILYLSDSNEFSYSPEVAVDAFNTLHVVYSKFDELNNWNLYYQFSTNTGASWSQPTLINGNKITMSPKIQISDNGKIIVCFAAYDNITHLWSVDALASLDNGSTWSNPTKLTSAQQLILSPDFKLQGDYVFLTWQDFRNGKSEIYFKKLKYDENIDVAESGNELNLNVWPVVFQNLVNFELSTVEDSEISIEIYNSTGQSVTRVDKGKHLSGNHFFEVDLSQLSAGIYTYRIISNQTQSVGKLIKTE